MSTTTTGLESKPKSTRATAEPLPYIIAFAILFLILLAVLTWTIDLYNKAHKCELEPNIWCFDTWQCNNNCAGSTNNDGQPVNACFDNATGPTGLASCLFGPDSTQASLCFTPPNTGTNELACACTEELTNTRSSCLANCPQSLGDVPADAVCCTTGSTDPACNTSSNG